jgi:hypothetical protein
MPINIGAHFGFRMKGRKSLIGQWILAYRTKFQTPAKALIFVIAGLDPAIHTDARHTPIFIMDARVKPAHDD